MAPSRRNSILSKIIEKQYTPLPPFFLHFNLGRLQLKSQFVDDLVLDREMSTVVGGWRANAAGDALMTNLEVLLFVVILLLE